MKIHGILETALCAADLDKSERFYQNLFGFETAYGDERMRAIRIDDAHFLLLFLTGGSTEGVHTPGGYIPPHDGRGEMHMAFNVSEADLPLWKARLLAENVEIVSELTMNHGHSLYFHDPDGHVIELGTPGLWRK